MKTKLALLSLVLVAVPFVPETSSADSASAAVAVRNDVCESVAIGVRLASRRQARADFWLEVSNCINESGGGFFGGGFFPCLGSAWQTMQDDLQLAEDQFQCRLALCQELGETDGYDPDIDPNEFSANITNGWTPFQVGRTLVYEKQTPEGLERIEVTSTTDTVDIDGVPCRIIKDIVTLDGELIEDTDDFLSQHTSGDLWYFGEVARNFEDGILTDLDGSFRHGTDHAKAGIWIEGNQQVGNLYRQEYFLNEAEDLARVVALDQTVTVPAGTFTGCVQIEAFTPLEPGVVEQKYYAPGVGAVLEVDPATGARLELVQIIN